MSEGTGLALCHLYPELVEKSDCNTLVEKPEEKLKLRNSSCPSAVRTETYAPNYGGFVGLLGAELARRGISCLNEFGFSVSRGAVQITCRLSGL